MGRWLPGLRWLWGSVVFAFILGAFTNWLFGPFRENVASLLQTHWLMIGGALLVLGCLTLWAWLDHRRRQQQAETQRQWQAKQRTRHAQAVRNDQLRQYFSLFTPTGALRPEDLGFRVPTRQGNLDASARPHYEVYIPRHAVPYQPTGERSAPRHYETADLVAALSTGGFVLLGQPLEGKTRTLYEVVRHVSGYDIVRPDGQCPFPPEAAFTLFAHRKVILLLDDLNSYAGSRLDLLAFRERLQRYAAAWAIAATCRDGSELSVVEQALETSLHRFYEEIPLKLMLLPLTVDDKTQLSQAIGRAWAPQDESFFPTPGSLTMQDTLGAMRRRFATLSPEARDTIQALKLLAAAGVLPFTHQRLTALVTAHFHRRAFHLVDALERLANEDLIRRPGRQDPIQPEPAYLQGAVAYVDGSTPEEDFPELERVLYDLEDMEGLFYLGNTYARSLQQPQHSLHVYEQVLVLRPEEPTIWYNKGVVLGRLGCFEEALAAFERALTLRPEHPETWYNRGIVLGQLGRSEEALAAFELALLLQPEDPETWYNKGVVLGQLGRSEEELAAYEQALALRPEDPGTWHNKGVVLGQLGRSGEALTAFEQALALRLKHSAS